MIVVSEETLDEFRRTGKCERCDAYCKRREPDHLWAKGLGGGARLDVRCNLWAACTACHRLRHDGAIPLDELKELVARREGLTLERLTDLIHSLRRKRR